MQKELETFFLKRINLNRQRFSYGAMLLETPTFQH